MIAYDQLQEKIRRRLPDLLPHEVLHVRTWKGDRGFAIMRADKGYFIHEDGFKNTSLTCHDLTEVLKAVKHIGKREFPRSHRLKYYVNEAK